MLFSLSEPSFGQMPYNLYWCSVQYSLSSYWAFWIWTILLISMKSTIAVAEWYGLSKCMVCVKWDKNDNTLMFNQHWWNSLNPSPLVRTTVWTVVLGQSAYWASAFGISQSTIQKLQSLPNFRMAKKWVINLKANKQKRRLILLFVSANSGPFGYSHWASLSSTWLPY